MKRHVLFICVRNRVRSTFAEFYLRKQLLEKMEAVAEDITISSAGFYPKIMKDIMDEANIPLPEPFFHTHMSRVVRDLLGKKGFAVPDEWRSKPLTRDLVTAADVIVTALAWQKDEIAETYLEAQGKIFTFREMAKWNDDVLFEKIEGLPMDESFWEYCEEDPAYVTRIIGEVEDLMNRGLPLMIEKLRLK